jgi:superfamily II DNA/RNA helicase
LAAQSGWSQINYSLQRAPSYKAIGFALYRKDKKMITFQDMGLPDALNCALRHMQFNEPTPIQVKAIPLALEGRDILGSAQTGTGKTGAFGIPLIARLLLNPRGSALVMTPTRELAAQVMSHLQVMLGKQSKIRSALLIGGEPMPKQLQQIRSRPRLIVGTPGRINDHLKRGNLMLHDTDFLVLDETDRMLDMGFTIQIENVMKYMPAKRQTLLFSATIPKNIARIAAKYLNNPVHVAVNTTSAPAANIKQDILRIKEVEKYPSLLTQLNERKGSIIIFVKTKYGTEKMAARLSSEGHSADAIHGDLRQNKRDRVIAAFRKKKYRILVATDVAARGLDIPHIEHVINYDLPQCAEDYIHRIGRTARAGARGAALNLVTPADKGKWRAIDRLLNPVSSN